MKMTRRRFVAACFTSLLVGGGGAGAYGTLLCPNDLVIERRQIRLPGLAGLRVVVMSDFHLEPYTKLPLIERAVEKANALKPDLIVLPGDFITSNCEPMHDLAPALGKLKARLGVFATLGNHDCWHDWRLVLKTLEAAGIPVLENRGVTLRHGAQPFYLAGLKSAWGSNPVLADALAARPSRLPTIVSMHEPDYADHIAPTGQVDLQLSGHSHGGQVRLPVVGALSLPSWGRRYSYGLYQVRDLQVYTTRGIGTVGMPVRFLCPPEITEITLM